MALEEQVGEYVACVLLYLQTVFPKEWGLQKSYPLKYNVEEPEVVSFWDIELASAVLEVAREEAEECPETNHGVILLIWEVQEELLILH